MTLSYTFILDKPLYTKALAKIEVHVFKKQLIQ